MSMSKKDFIALADALRDVEGNVVVRGGELMVVRADVIDAIANFCESQNPAFKRDRWLDYLAGKCGPNGGKRSKPPFALDNDANACGTHRQAVVDVAPASLVGIFGEPGEGDGYKVSGEYKFVDNEGNVFTVYDYKATTLYDAEAWFRPSLLWASTEPFEFHIGAESGDVKAFVAWLESKVEA